MRKELVIILVVLAAILGGAVVAGNQRSDRRADTGGQRLADLREQAARRAAEGAVVVSETPMKDGILRVVEVPRRDIVGVDIVTCVLFVGQTSSITCLDESRPDR